MHLAAPLYSSKIKQRATVELSMNKTTSTGQPTRQGGSQINFFSLPCCFVIKKRILSVMGGMGVGGGGGCFPQGLLGPLIFKKTKNISFYLLKISVEVLETGHIQLVSYKRYLECTLVQWRLSIQPQCTLVAEVPFFL